VNVGARLTPALLALLVSAPSGPGPTSSPAVPGAAGTGASSEAGAGWSSLEPGLDLGTFAGPGRASGDGKIWVVRIDPARFELRLVNASAGDARPRTVRGWATSAGAVAGVNAGMFQTDGLTSVGLMRTRGHQNNPRKSSRYHAVLAFDPVDARLPLVRILDAACGELEASGRGYDTLIQSIRMVSCDRRNVWAPDAKRWSTAAIGVDGAGRVLFIHARSAWPVHDVIEALLALPLDLRRAMYVEGGPEAQLFVRAGGREIERLGALEGAAQDVHPGFAWEIPNAVVAVRRGAAEPAR
jgi:Phosphodiester glycosidase